MSQTERAVSSSLLKTRSWWREKCRDLYFFETVVLRSAWPDRFHDFGEINRDMCRFLNVRTNPSRKKFLSAFRLSFKTTVLQGLFDYEFCWALAENRPLGMFYNTATKENSSNFNEAIRYDLTQNDLLKWIFSELPRGEQGFDTFTKQQVRYRHVRLDFASLDTIQVSRHSPIIVNDDLENDVNALSDTMREDLKSKWRYQKAILTKIRKRGLGLEIDIGTPYHFQGLIWHIRSLPSYDKLIIPCWVEKEGKKVVTFPEVYELEDFLEKREEMGSAIFSAQMLLHPLPEEDALCSPRWLRYAAVLPENSWRSMVVDPGGSDPKTKDQTGISIVDTDEKGDMYNVYYRKVWLTPVELMDAIGALKEAYKPDDIRLEKDRYTVTIADLFRHRFPLMNISFVEHQGREKRQRIWRLKQWLQSGRFFIHPDDKELETDLLQYPHVEHDDGLDALAYQLDIRRVPPKVHRPRFEPVVEKTFDEEFDRYVRAHRPQDDGYKNENDKIY